jgi:chromosome segregation ATPase
VNIEDFKKIVAGYQVGDELRLEVLCSTWNREADNAAAEELLSDFRDQIGDLEDLARARLEGIEALTEQLENAEEVLAGYRHELAKQNELIKALRQALQEGC